ncbi:hypothetical protein M404DRAFT_1008282, partial [Pisolithus tinctorius Marx 270]
SSNHKTDAVIAKELESSTGIASRFLTDFSPGMGDAHSRFLWASSRRTSRSEDIAYSHFGLFNIHLPVLYGEPAETARAVFSQKSYHGLAKSWFWIG